MADTGAPWNLPYPAIGDAANGPAQIGALAAAADAALDSVNAKTVPSSPLTGSAAFTAATGWSLVDARFMSLGRLCLWWVDVSRTGAAITVTANGDIANVAIAQLVPSMVPVTQMWATAASSGRAASGTLNAVGAVQLCAVGGGGVSIATGERISLGGAYIG